MSIKVLEVNVDDYLHGGVYALVTDIIKKLPDDITADIAALEPFVEKKHIEMLKEYNCNVYYVGLNENKIKKQFHIYKNVKDLIKREQYDVVHLHSDVAHKILVSGLAAKKNNVKRIILHSHANDVEGSHKKLRTLFHKICAKQLKRIPSLHLATSKGAGEWMFPDDGQFTVLNNGVTYDRFYYNEEKRRELRSEMMIEDKMVIGFVGRFVDQKNPFYLIDIMRELIVAIPNSVMLCIGQGKYRDEMERQTEEYGLREHFIFMDTVDNIEDYYQCMDLLVLPSNYEGFGLVAVEAQISGTPVIASSYVPEMTKISDNITYIPIGPENVKLWCETIHQYTSYNKKNMRETIDKKYDLQYMVSALIQYYRGQ